MRSAVSVWSIRSGGLSGVPFPGCSCREDMTFGPRGRPRLLVNVVSKIIGVNSSLRADGTAGLPRNLAVLHTPPLRPVAVRYWARTMRSPMGELCFAAHSRHAEAEMRTLANDLAARITRSPALAELLNDRSAPSADRS